MALLEAPEYPQVQPLKSCVVGANRTHLARKILLLLLQLSVPNDDVVVDAFQ